MTHIRAVARLAVASTLCAATSHASAEMARMGVLLGEIQLLAAGVPVDGHQTMSTTEAQAAIDAALAPLTTCDPVASLFLHTGEVLHQPDHGPTTWIISGPECAQTFAFASGSVQLDIIDTINRFTECTGVIASQHSGVSFWVRLDSTGVGADAFLSVVQTQGPTPYIHVTPSSPPVFRASDHGAVFADLDCDLTIGPRDLHLLLAAWGACLPPLPEGEGGSEGVRGCAADLNRDGAISGIDLAMLLASWAPK